MKPGGIGKKCILEKVRETLFIALFGLGNLFPLYAAVFPEVSGLCTRCSFSLEWHHFNDSTPN